MVAQIGEPLLELVRLSPDFDVAYRPLLSMARQLSAVDLSASRRLLLALSDASPRRLEATDMLQRLSSHAGRPDPL
jgi:spermidine synthase